MKWRPDQVQIWVWGSVSDEHEFNRIKKVLYDWPKRSRE